MKYRTWLSAAVLSVGFGTAAMAQVSGTVTLDGKPPVMQPINMAGVAACAAEHTTPVMQETAIVSAKGGIANVVVSIVKEEGKNLPAMPPKEPAVLDQQGCMYTPHVLAVQVGQKIIAKNSDKFLHNVHTQPDKNTPENKAQPNQDLKGMALKTPTEAEYYHVKCDVHPWMSGWIAAIDNPFFAVTDADGKFTLPAGLPDGTYKVHFWHEKFEEQDGSVTVAGGKGTVDQKLK